MKEATKEKGVLNDPGAVYTDLGVGVGGPPELLRDAIWELGYDDNADFKTYGLLNSSNKILDEALNALNNSMEILAKAAGQKDKFKPFKILWK